MAGVIPSENNSPETIAVSKRLIDPNEYLFFVYNSYNCPWAGCCLFVISKQRMDLQKERAEAITLNESPQCFLLLLNRIALGEQTLWKLLYVKHCPGRAIEVPTDPREVVHPTPNGSYHWSAGKYKGLEISILKRKDYAQVRSLRYLKWWNPYPESRITIRWIYWFGNVLHFEN